MNDRLFELHAEVCKTLANRWRLKIIWLLRDGERPLKELVNEVGVPLANVSQHLNIMKAKGVVEVRRATGRTSTANAGRTTDRCAAVTASTAPDRARGKCSSRTG